ncbi:MAG: hypothetical protein ACRC6N_05355, partial [Plesiomonas sp.]|uniref:hypothetical protein n=1 Tax=Plesiomonas sp. TaxID=2486279 RepID=UPI003F2FA146
NGACEETLVSKYPAIYVKPSCNITDAACDPTNLIRLPVPSLRAGTLPIADVFWYCGGGVVMQVLPRLWHGLCAPVVLEGRLTVFPLDDDRLETLMALPKTNTLVRQKRGVEEVNTLIRAIGGNVTYSRYLKPGEISVANQWGSDPNVYVDWRGTPVGVPEGHFAQKLSSSGAWIFFLPHVQVARNVIWINYIWYNQQRFINHMVATLGLISEQLHATTLMAVQNRFALDMMLGPDQEVCHMFQEECCAVVPLNTGPAGPINLLLERMIAQHDEMVNNNADKDPNWFQWLFSSSWMA